MGRNFSENEGPSIMGVQFAILLSPLLQLPSQANVEIVPPIQSCRRVGTPCSYITGTFRSNNTRQSLDPVTNYSNPSALKLIGIQTYI